MKYKLLIVDDEPANLRMLERLLANEYEVLTATSGQDAIGVLEAHDVALIVSDQRMPGMTGLEFLKKASKIRAHTVRIILTGYTDIETLVEAINSGVVYKYITKPWSNTELVQSLSRAAEYYEVTKSRHLLAEQNHRLRSRMNSSTRGFVVLIIELLGLLSPKIRAHARRTAKYACRLGANLGLNGAELEQLFIAASLHEVAHVRMPQHLLSRTTLLGNGELRTMRDCFRQGVDMLARVPELEGAAEAISFQHNQFDGLGSFCGLSGDQIPLYSRIIAIADAYDEMRQPALETNGYGHADALSILQGAAGRKFDPELVSIFCRVNLDGQQILEPARTVLKIAA